MSSIGQVVGGAIGFYLGGPTGASIGMTIGGYLDPPKGPTIKGPRLSDLSAQTASYGANIGRGYGMFSVQGNVFWVEGGGLREVVKKKSSGGKGGGGGTTTKTFEYFATFAVSLHDGEIDGFKRVWLGNELIANTAFTDIASGLATNERYVVPGTLVAQTNGKGKFTIYTGADDQPADPRMITDLGAANAPAYRGLSYAVFYDWPLAKLSNSLMAAQVKAEIITSRGTDAAVLLTSYTAPDGTDSSISSQQSPICWYISAEKTTVYHAQWSGAVDPTIDRVFKKSEFNLAGGGYKGTVSHGVIYGYLNPPFGIDDTDNSYIRNDAGPGDYGLFDYPTSSAVPQSFVFKNGRHYRWSTSNSTELYDLDNETTITLASTVYSVTVDDAGDVYVLLGTSIRKYDPDLVFITSYSVTFTGEPYSHTFAATESRIHWSEGYLWCVFSSDCRQIYRLKDDFSETFTLIATLPAITNHNQLASRFEVEGDIYTRFCWNYVAKTYLVESWKLPAINSAGVPLSTVISTELLRSEIISAGDIDVAALTDTVNGYRLSGVDAIRGNVGPLQGAYLFDLIPSGYKIKAVKRGGASVKTISIDELNARPDGSAPGVALMRQREMDSQLPKKVILRHLDPAREYDVNEQYSPERMSSDAVNIIEINLPLVLSPAEAAKTAEVFFNVPWLERYGVEFTLGPEHFDLEPSDTVTITTDTESITVRIESINYGINGILECQGKVTASNIYTASTSAVGGTGIVADDLVAYAGSSEFIVADIPLMRDADDIPLILGAMSGASSAWPGGVIYKSNDSEVTWSDAQAFTSSVTMGVVAETLTANSGFVIDYGNTITVILDTADMTLSSITETQMNTGLNYYAWGAAGRWEIGQFITATLVSAGAYTVSGLLRGKRGTEQYTGTHASGDRFILLDDPDLAGIAIDISHLGVARHYRGVTSGQDIDDVTSQLFTYSGVNKKPFSAVNPAGVNASGVIEGLYGTYTGGYTLNQSGPYNVGPAVLLDGTTGYINLGAPPELNITAAWHLESWVYLTSTPNGCCVIAEQYTGSGNNILFELGFGLSVLSANLTVGYYTGSAWKTVIGSALTLNEWHLVAGEYDGTNLRLFADGVQVATNVPGTAPTAGISNEIWIGRRHDGGGSPFFPGRMAAAAIYGSAIGLARHQSHYNTGTTSGDYDADVAADTPVGYWKLNEIAGTNASDSGVNSNNATDWTFSWDKRSRYETSWWVTGVARPLGESSESWEIDIMSGSTVVRTLTATTGTVIYSEANQITDFGSAQASLTIRIYQMSSVVGRGYKLEATIS